MEDHVSQVLTNLRSRNGTARLIDSLSLIANIQLTLHY